MDEEQEGNNSFEPQAPSASTSTSVSTTAMAEAMASGGGLLDPGGGVGVDPGEPDMASLTMSSSDFGGARPKQYSNVIVDDSPLQNQMEKNKECKRFSKKQF